jgi:hypothetical protein
MKIVIATPFYEMKGFSPYISSLAKTLAMLAKVGIEFDYWELSGDSYVDRARNTIARRFLDSGADHLIFIDSDMSWDLESFSNLMKAPEDIVGGAYPCKNNWEFYSVVIDTDSDGYPIVNEETGLIQAWGVPTGFMKIHRSVFERLIPHVNTYEDGDTTFYNFFGRIVEGGKSYGEDISFCIRAGNIGIKKWIEPRCSLSHYGVKEWNGNYHDYLMRQPGGAMERKDELS